MASFDAILKAANDHDYPHSTSTICAAVWIAVFNGRKASSFSNLGCLRKYISGRAYISIDITSTRIV